VAAANNIIILFPQAAIQYSDPYSYLGCWDFVGFSGELYGELKYFEMLQL
jgi:hypothetical protein